MRRSNISGVVMKNLGHLRKCGFTLLLVSALYGCGGGYGSPGGGNPPPPTPSIVVVAGTGAMGYTGDGGPATSAALDAPYGVWVDLNNNDVFIADTGNSVIRKVDSTGKITTVAGNGNLGFSGDGGAATSATLDKPYRAVLDKFNNLYIADYYNNVVRKVDKFGTISTVAGTGTQGYNGDGIPANTAQLSLPGAVAVDSVGNLYIADTWNNRIRKVDVSTGMISSIAGTGFAGVLGDGGPASMAQVNEPEGLAVDAFNNIYIADFGNSKIRMVSSLSGNIDTFAGTGSNSFSGDGGPATSATLNQPTGVAVDEHGNVYIADNQNSRVRKVTTAGTISTIISPTMTGIITPFFPEDVAVDSAGDVFVADFNNMRVLALK